MDRQLGFDWTTLRRWWWSNLSGETLTTSCLTDDIISPLYREAEMINSILSSRKLMGAAIFSAAHTHAHTHSHTHSNGLIWSPRSREVWLLSSLIEMNVISLCGTEAAAPIAYLHPHFLTHWHTLTHTHTVRMESQRVEECTLTLKARMRSISCCKQIKWSDQTENDLNLSGWIDLLYIQHLVEISLFEGSLPTTYLCVFLPYSPQNVRAVIFRMQRLKSM